jgi:hypothetical protein
MTYYFSKTLKMHFSQAIQHATESLTSEAFDRGKDSLFIRGGDRLNNVGGRR